MTVRARLILTIVGISVLLAVPAIFAASRLADVRALANEQRQHGVALMALGRLQTALAGLDRFMRGYIAVGGDDQRVGIDSSLSAARLQLEILRNGGYRNETQAAGTRIDAIEQSADHIVSLIESGKKTEATAYFDQVKPRLEEANSALDLIAGAVDARSNRDLEQASRITAAVLIPTLFGLLAALTSVLLLGYWSTRAITTPVQLLRESMANVADGDYVVPDNLPAGRVDEIGDLTRSFSEMTAQLARLDKMKAEFISIATHELKTPINVISGYADLMDEGLYGALNEEQRGALQAIREQSWVLTRLVNQLLDVSRLEAGGLHVEMDQVGIEDLINSLERSFGILARRRNIRMTFALGANVPPAIEGDADRLREQVLGNLLTNALKFTPEGGHVGVKVSGSANMVHIEVSDTGVGIASEQLPYVFDKFYQVGQQARSKGAGLGLAIARDIVEAHGGTIAVESIEHEGTTFRIDLPVHQQRTNGAVPAGVTAGKSGS